MFEPSTTTWDRIIGGCVASVRSRTSGGAGCTGRPGEPGATRNPFRRRGRTDSALIVGRIPAEQGGRATPWLGCDRKPTLPAVTDGASDREGECTELLQALIRNACVNDGSVLSGFEHRSADLLAGYLEGPGLDLQTFEAAPGRTSLVARIEGTDPTAPSLLLMGHTDVVPVNPDHWSHDPFGGELIDGEVWGRGAVDMLNLTSSMAVVFRSLVQRGFRPKGDLLYFAVADEEAGSAHGARWVADHHPDAIRCEYLLTESGGLHDGTAEAPAIGVTVGEKGVAWRRLRVHGTPGHGSMPFRIDNALVKAAAVVQRLAEYRPAPRFHELWPARVESLNVPDELKQALLDPAAIDAALAALPS